MEKFPVYFFKDGFFGFGEKGDFKYWSLAHFIPIILYIAAIVLIFIFRDKIKNWKHEEAFRTIYAAVMLFVEMSYFWRLLYVGSSNSGDMTLLDKLPLQVCEWTCILAVFMMMKKIKWIYPICFYVCLTIGIFPLLTPSVITTTGPGYYRYYQYWLEHILPPLAVFYMTFVHGFKPTKKGIINATAYMSVLVGFALVFNHVLNDPNGKFAGMNVNANYLYINKGTADGGGSIMDPIYNLVGGSTPLLLLILGIFVISIFFAAYFIDRLIRNKIYPACKAKIDAKKAEKVGASNAEQK